MDGAPVYFADVTARAGLQKFRHVSGVADKRYILESPSGGVALFDYDNDGWLDIYLVNGSTFAAWQGKEKPPRAALFRNNKDGAFTDVTAKAGVANERWGFGVAAGDYDNDGWEDLYVTQFRQEPRSIATTATARSPMWPKKPARRLQRLVNRRDFRRLRR